MSNSADTPNYLKAAMLMPANLFALAAGGIAALFLGDVTPLLAAGGGSVIYLSMLSAMPSFRRAVNANFHAQRLGAPAEESGFDALLAELAPSQREHYESLVQLKQRIVASYHKMPGGRVLVATSEQRLDALLMSFVRLVSTLNSYRNFLSAADKKGVEEEMRDLLAEAKDEVNPRLKEVKMRRVDILQKRLARFLQAEESREVVSHQLASIEDVLRLTHEQSIAIRDPEVVSRQLESLTQDIAATEETVREMESFMQVTEVLPSATPRAISSGTKTR
jgi:hypothetical protein